MGFLEIDGSYLEGGGQILRNALSFSCILQRPVRIVKIRANRPNPGLSNQHLYGLNLLQEITGANIKGNTLKSTEVEFSPVKIKSGRYKVDTRTAASLTLVLQAALPVLAFGDKISTVEIIGGTNVGMAPQVDFFTEVFRANLERFGVTFDFDLYKRGYYPRGGGCCEVTIKPVQQLRAADITHFGNLREICGWSFVAGRLPTRIATDMAAAAKEELKGVQVIPNIESYKESPNMAPDNGSGIILKATTSDCCTLGASALGEKQVNGQELGLKAGIELMQYLKDRICVDSHVQDQLIIFMALATGESRIQTVALTNHTRTAIHVAELFGVKFKVDEIDKNRVVISCGGLAYKNPNMH